MTPLVFLFLVREILICHLPEKDCVEILDEDMTFSSPEVQLLNISKHLREEAKTPRNEKNKQTFFVGL